MHRREVGGDQRRRVIVGLEVGFHDADDGSQVAAGEVQTAGLAAAHEDGFCGKLGVRPWVL